MLQNSPVAFTSLSSAVIHVLLTDQVINNSHFLYRMLIPQNSADCLWMKKLVNYMDFVSFRYHLIRLLLPWRGSEKKASCGLLLMNTTLLSPAQLEISVTFRISKRLEAMI